MPVIEWFAYCFPNRRSDKPVVEVMLDFKPADQGGAPLQVSEIKEILVSSEILSAEEVFPVQALPDDRMHCYVSLLLQLALLFQTKAGHRVSFYTVLRGPDQNRLTGLVEHEHCDVGMTAVKLAIELIRGERRQLAAPFQTFEKFARERLLPIDTEAIINAARRRDIPVIQLERQPYKREDFKRVTSGDCIRRNGLLMLGYGAHQHLLDGTFCLDLSAEFNQLRTNKHKRKTLLASLGIPVFNSEEERVTGLNKYHLIAVNGRLAAVVNQPGGELSDAEKLHDSTRDFILQLSREIDLAPVVISIKTNDLSRSLTQVGGGVVDFDLAPELDRYLGQDQYSDLLDSIADQIVAWLFAEKSYTRMPIIAITGTNGKTTTTRMINHILMNTGLKPGMVCTDGAFLNGKQISKGDECTDTGHLKVLTSKDVDVAVLETHHAGIMVRGFAFGWCDIAICLNVSEDHQGKLNIETVEQMATLKQALVERARQAVILNADDPNCLAMITATVAKDICLVSIELDIDKLRHQVSQRVALFCVLETIENKQWLVIYDRLQRLPIMKVVSIPATFDGTARFNVSNAMHAIVACYLLNVSVEAICTAMAGFSSGPELTPGRLNIFDDLPFRIIMDFAHNPDGMRNLCEFIDGQDVSGRKLIAFAATANRKDEIIKNMARSVAGHFDVYFCKEYAPVGDETPREVAHLLRQGLLEGSVAETQIKTTSFGKDVVFEIFDSCETGDLLVMLLGHVEKYQLAGHIREYAAKLVGFDNS